MAGANKWQLFSKLEFPYALPSIFSGIKISATYSVLGEKIVVTLSDGKTIYTYENLLVEEEGKLLYKGANSTIDLTGGVVVYEEWD